LARSAIFTLGLASTAAAIGLYFSARLGATGPAVAATVPAMLGVFAALRMADQLGAGLLGLALGGAPVRVHPGGLATAASSGLLTLVALKAAVRQVRVRTGAIPGAQDHARELRTLALDELRERNKSRPARV